MVSVTVSIKMQRIEHKRKDKMHHRQVYHNLKYDYIKVT